MDKLKITTDPGFEEAFEKYPSVARNKMDYLRALVIETAEETESVSELRETLKWGEPSFVTKNGSTLRMDWKERAPEHYAMYFQCSSRLVETFKTVFEDRFVYEGKRALIFQLDQEIPVAELKECIKAALRYHLVKDLMTLGI